MKAQPIATAPKGRFVLVKHVQYGWIEAMFDERVYTQSIQIHGPEVGGYAWSNAALDNWLYHRDMEAWAELPEWNESKMVVQMKAIKLKQLILSVPGVDGVRVIIRNDGEGDIRAKLLIGDEFVTDYLFAKNSHHRALIAALGFPVEPEDIETSEVVGQVKP